MSLRINSNITAMNTHRQLSINDRNQGSAIEKLSSGYRINSAADDPAGLALSENLTAQTNGLGQAMNNANDAINLMKTADGSLSEIQNLVQNIRDTAVHAANTGANDALAAGADQTQISKDIEALDRIASTTAFGTKKLLDGSASSLTFQVGANAGETITTSISAANSAALGNVADGYISAIDVTAAGGAQAAIKICDAAISQLSTQRATIGAQQNGIQSTVNALGIAQENISASVSTIKDTDMAATMVQFTKSQILLQASTSMLAQANSAPQNVLSLLKG